MDIADITKNLNIYTAAELGILLTGIILFAVWLYRTSLGRKALIDSVPRRHDMPPYMPIIPIFIWLSTLGIAISVKDKFLSGMEDWQSALIDNIILSIGSIIAIAAVLLLARAYFAGRLKGFGLNYRTIYKDLPAAVINLLSAWPVVVAMIMATTYLGKIIFGREFHLQRHDELELIISHKQLSLRIMIVIVTIIIAPIVEELMFRGLFQSMVRTIWHGSWVSIAITSAVFSMQHINNPGHWPALFALSMVIGYAYEKSGSLFRSIFIHSLFNASSVIALLLQ